MEAKNNKIANILSLVGIIVFFIVLILIVVFVFKNKKNDKENDYYAPIATESISPTEAPITTDDTLTNIQDITTLLDGLVLDIAAVLQCNNPATLTLSTPGIEVNTLTPLRTNFEKANIDLWQAYKADVESSTALVKGDYLIVMDIRTATDTNKLYVYVWTDYLNGSYVVSSLDFEIGDF